MYNPIESGKHVAALRHPARAAGFARWQEGTNQALYKAGVLIFKEHRAQRDVTQKDVKDQSIFTLLLYVFYSFLLSYRAAGDTCGKGHLGYSEKYMHTKRHTSIRKKCPTT